MFQGIGEHMAKECNVSYDRVFASVTVIVVDVFDCTWT